MQPENSVLPLIDQMKAEFERSGFKVIKDKFSDRSSAWLEIYPRGKRQKGFSFCVSFNYKGTKITDLDMFKGVNNITTYFKHGQGK